MITKLYKYTLEFDNSQGELLFALTKRGESEYFEGYTPEEYEEINQMLREIADTLDCQAENQENQESLKNV